MAISVEIVCSVLFGWLGPARRKRFMIARVNRSVKDGSMGLIFQAQLLCPVSQCWREFESIKMQMTGETIETTIIRIGVLQ